MAKPIPPKTRPVAPSHVDRLSWPTTPKELSLKPRLFRIHRLNAFEWQAYVTQDDGEFPIGKPDLFDILRTKVAGVMRAEGQAEFLALKQKAEKAEIGNSKEPITDAK